MGVWKNSMGMNLWIKYIVWIYDTSFCWCERNGLRYKEMKVWIVKMKKKKEKKRRRRRTRRRMHFSVIKTFSKLVFKTNWINFNIFPIWEQNHSVLIKNEGPPHTCVQYLANYNCLLSFFWQLNLSPTVIREKIWSTAVWINLACSVGT